MPNSSSDQHRVLLEARNRTRVRTGFRVPAHTRAVAGGAKRAELAARFGPRFPHHAGVRECPGHSDPILGCPNDTILSGHLMVPHLM